MGLLFWVCGWGCLLIMAVSLGFACREFRFCSQWWGLWVVAFGADGGLVLVYPLHLFSFSFLALTVDCGFLWVANGGGGVKCMYCSGGGLVVVAVSVNLWWILYRKNERENK